MAPKEWSSRWWTNRRRWSHWHHPDRSWPQIGRLSFDGVAPTKQPTHKPGLYFQLRLFLSVPIKSQPLSLSLYLLFHGSIFQPFFFFLIFYTLHKHIFLLFIYIFIWMFSPFVVLAYPKSLFLFNIFSHSSAAVAAAAMAGPSSGVDRPRLPGQPADRPRSPPSNVCLYRHTALFIYLSIYSFLLSGILLKTFSVLFSNQRRAHEAWLFNMLFSL